MPKRPFTRSGKALKEDTLDDTNVVERKKAANSHRRITTWVKWACAQGPRANRDPWPSEGFFFCTIKKYIYWNECGFEMEYENKII